MPTPVIPTSTKRPGVYLRVTLGVGPASAGDAPIRVLLIGNMLAAGSATVEELVAVTGEDSARDLFGAGSELHLMARAAFDVYPSATVYACPVAQSAGAQSAGTLTYAGTATAPGTAYVKVIGEEIRVAVANGDAAADVATAVAAAINDETDWPVTAAAALGVVTVTAKNTGPRGDLIGLTGTIDAAGLTATPAAMTGGTTADDPQNALDAVAAERFHYIVSPYQDAVGLADVEAHCAAYAEPEEGKRQRWIAGSKDTLATTTTLATGRNDARGQIVHLHNAPQTPGMLAAAQAARRASREGADVAANLNGEALPGILPPESSADYPNGTAIASALNNGITPLEVAQGEVRIVRSITTRSQDAAGNPSYAVLDSHKVTVPDFIADDLAVGYVAEFSGFKASPDVDDPQELPDGVLTPSVVKDWITARLVAHEEAALIVGVEARASELSVELLDSPAGCFAASIPIDVIEWANMFSGDLRQVG
ncbi:MAG: phage tail sheath subtilisin-like domain-containing protein [Sandaracinaceae bacterium]